MYLIYLTLYEKDGGEKKQEGKEKGGIKWFCSGRGGENTAMLNLNCQAHYSPPSHLP